MNKLSVLSMIFLSTLFVVPDYGWTGPKNEGKAIEKEMRVFLRSVYDNTLMQIGTENQKTFDLHMIDLKPDGWYSFLREKINYFLAGYYSIRIGHLPRNHLMFVAIGEKGPVKGSVFFFEAKCEKDPATTQSDCDSVDSHNMNPKRILALKEIKRYKKVSLANAPKPTKG